MASTMETFAKVAGVTSMATGGLDKITKILTGEAKMLKNQQKRQRAEEKDQKALIIAEEKDIHANWLREKGSLIQAIKDDASGYARQTQEARELQEEKRIEDVKAKQKNKMIRNRRWAFELGGLKEEDFLKQHQFNIEIKASRQAEKDLKKAEKAAVKKDELRIASLAAEYHRLGAFDGLDKKAIAAEIRSTEAKEAAAAKDEEIALIQEKYLSGSNVRLNKLVASLENEGMFATKSKDQIKALILAKELTDKQNARKEEILKGEEDYLGFVRERTGSTGTGGGTGGGTGPDVNSGTGAGFGGGEVVQAVEEQTDEIIYGLGNHSPPFLETLTEDGIEVTNAPTVDGENIGAESAPDTNGVNGSDVVQPVILTDQEGDPVITESEQMESLLAIEDKKMDYLRRGEARDVKRMRLETEAGRDKSRLLPKAPGGPMLNKVAPDEGGGLLSTLGKIFMSPLGRIGMALTGLTTGVGVLGTATGLLTTATTSMGSFANKLLPNWMKKMLPAPGSPTVGGPGVGRGNAPGSKATQFKKGWSKNAAEAAKHTKGISRNATRATKLLGRAALPLTIALEAFNMYSTEQDESLDRTEKNIKHTESVGGMGGAAAGGAMGAAIGTAIFPGVGTIIGGLIGGGLGYFLGGEISKTVAQEVSDKTDLATGEERLGELPEADQKLLMREAEKQGAVDVGLGHGTISDLEKLSKLDLSSIESLLDQETWEKEDRDKLMKIRSAKLEGREINVKDGGFWDDDTMTSGEKGTAGPSINVEEKLAKLRKANKKGRFGGYQKYAGGVDTGEKTETREMTPEEIAQTQKENDEFDVEFAEGEGADAEDKLDAAAAQKRLDARKKKSPTLESPEAIKFREDNQKFQYGKYTRKDADSPAILTSKKEKEEEEQEEEITLTAAESKTKYRKGGMLERRELKKRLKKKKGRANKKQNPNRRVSADYESFEGEDSGMDMSHEADQRRAETLGKDPSSFSITALERVKADAMLEQGMTAEEADQMLVDKGWADMFHKMGAKEGSIFTHDTNIEKALWDIWTEEKSFFDPKTLETSVGIEGEKDLPLTMLPDGESGDFSPQMNMFGNAGELMPIPVIDVSPTAPEMGGTGLMTPAGPMLEQSLITKMMEMQTQADTASAGGGKTQLMNAPTTIMNDNSQMIQSGSTARAGVIKPGTGRG